MTTPNASALPGVPLRLLGWEYDQAADMILDIFTDAPAADDPNPAAFQPALRYVVALEVIASEIHPLIE